MSLLDSARGADPFELRAPDASYTVVRDGSSVRLTLRGSFDQHDAAQVGALLDWLAAQGSPCIVAEVVDEPAAADGFAFLRLNTLARSRTLIDSRGGSLRVVAAPRLHRTLAAMRLEVAP